MAMLAAQISQLRADFESLLSVLDAPQLPAPYGRVLGGRFKRAVSPLLHDLAGIEAEIAAGKTAEAWSALAVLERRAQVLFEEALEFLGGVAIRELPQVQILARHAQQLVESLVQEAGVSWSPVVIVGRWTGDDVPETLAVSDMPDDNLIRLPLPRWDVWYLPLLAHDYGFWIAKRGHISDLDNFVSERLVAISGFFSSTPAIATGAEERTLWLPEIVALLAALQRAEDGAAFRERVRGDMETLLQRQRVHLWHWIADAFGAAFLGPAYAYALLFLILNPARLSVEGASARDYGRSRYMPSDARRMILVLHILAALDVRARRNTGVESSLYQTELQRIADIWEQALELLGERANYERLRVALQPWCEVLYLAMERHFGVVASQNVEKWQLSQQFLGPVLRQGTALSTPPEIQALVSAAWSARARHPTSERIAALTVICEQLLRGDPPSGGLLAQPLTLSSPQALIQNWLADLETDIERLTALFRVPVTASSFADNTWASTTHRDAVAGRFFRLLSAQDYGLRKDQGLLRRGIAAETLMLPVVERMQGGALRELQVEVLDYLGGVLIREYKLDGAICTIADALLRDFARMTGVNWTSRVVPGRNPLFSPATDMVQLHFPDWALWNLPLMAHEFGHVAALSTPAFLDFLAQRALDLAEGHPDAEGWTRLQVQAYVSQRSMHLHEFFADAFALYCQGPAFAFDMVLLHLNPAEAYLPRGQHPAHAERFAVLLAVLERMNAGAQQDAYDAGPYAPVIARLRDTWDQALSATGAQPDAVARFHGAQARSLAGRIYDGLEQSYRLGAQFSPEAWKQAVDAALVLLNGAMDVREKGLRDILNIAWACRIRHPERTTDIAQHIWHIWKHWDFASSW